MGSIAVVLEVENDTDDGEDVTRLKVDVGGKHTLWVPLYGAPGCGSKPVAGDYAALVGHPGGSKATAVAFASADVSTVGENGEVVYQGRDADGAVVSTFHMKQDGSIRIENDNGYMELKADGQLDVNGNFTVDA